MYNVIDESGVIDEEAVVTELKEFFAKTEENYEHFRMFIS
jgi:hypothetical protein